MAAAPPTACPARALVSRLATPGADGPPSEVTFAEAHEVACSVAAGAVDPLVLSALLVLLASRGESGEVVAGFARAMRDACTRVAVPGPVVEIVGTGGDGHCTMNISTAAAVLAAACGVPVAKHGSIGVTSLSGAADVLSALGVARLPAPAVAPCLARAGIAFMFAPLFHPAMRHVAPVRAALRVRTLFNVLGPLLNPAGATRLLLGVYHPRLLPVMAHAARALGAERALVVHCAGVDGSGVAYGLDELATLGPSQAVELLPDGSSRQCTIDPALWGVPRCTLAHLRGGTPAENAAHMRRLLAGAAPAAPDDDSADAHLARTVALNAGAALYVYGAADSVRAGYERALEVLRSGAAAGVLDRWAAVSQELAAEGGGK